MLQYIVRRVLLMIPTLLGITLITFLLLKLVPGDPVQVMSGGFAARYSREAHQRFIAAYGLDKPVLQQYGIWLSRFARMDFGNSLVDGRPVMQVIAEKLPVTIYLNIASILVIFVVAFPSGIRAAVKKDKFYDKATGVSFFILYSLFVPWVAIMLIKLLSVKINLLPLYGITSDNYSDLSFFGKLGDVAVHSILPVAVMSYSSFAFYSRVTRGSVLEVLNMEFVTTARAKGLPERKVIYGHAVRNAMIPFVTLFGSLLPSLIGGSVIVERIFSIDGIGNLFFNAVSSRDLFMIMGLTSITAILTLVGILFSDIGYAIVDPRIKLD